MKQRGEFSLSQNEFFCPTRLETRWADGPSMAVMAVALTLAADASERRQRAERTRTTVVATCYLLGSSTRRMDKLVQSLGITTLWKTQASEMGKALDAHVEEFRTRRQR